MLPCCGRDGLLESCRTITSRLYRFRLPPRRFVASAPTHNAWKHETVELRIGVGGGVKLDVFSPRELRQSPNGPRNLLVHIPSGPACPNGTTSSLLQSTLARLQDVLPPSTSLVRINYSLAKSADFLASSNELKVFPTPIHEVAAAFDYLTSSTSTFNVSHDEAPRICLLGRHIGGALATMLALTEPNAIHALAVAEPMVDWVGIYEVLEKVRPPAVQSLLSSPTTQAQKHAQKRARTSKSGNLHDTDAPSVVAAAEELVKLRSKLFNTPSAYFDPFASPLLFLRAPGRDTPLANATTGDQLLSEIDQDDVDMDVGGGEYSDYDHDAHQSSPSSMGTSSGITSHGEVGVSASHAPTVPPRRRKVLRRWPAVGNPESVTLPRVRIFVQSHVEQKAPDGESNAIDVTRGHAALMRAQGTELAELMRRACFIGREKGFAEERVQLQLCDPSPWAVDAGGGMQEAAMKWLGEMFKKD
ncbi:hypothetical protein G647_05522 [Cladophialophora carrionii CBS 160.54]|uniref:Alpha/beta hydrolase fold-3 domain-containing protein n=1 Tax=Cladophialophora carrionii CBS 160.54 TaxID=1279043 RepID=V9DCM0_9EURO|nr:uncharacterized protein G647_05522 [Cladophialophora carrionii CBS 160.54]ETI23717.1 hypothetical protein G647_05522 [Cladophialophora carrionii CBS 160.54]